MFRARLTLIALSLPLLAACAEMPTASRNTVLDPAMTAPLRSGDEMQLAAQAEALDVMTRDMLRRATLRGAAGGAIAGCGLAVVTGSGKNSCLKAAVVGGAVGGWTGHAAGRKEAEKRVELVSLSRLKPSVVKARDQMGLVDGDLNAVLNTQNAELTALPDRVATGGMTAAQADARRAEIAAYRADLAKSFSLSASQARDAHAALLDAKMQGQDGLDWYLMQTRKIETEAVSARSQISLL
ncbi:MAG: hypothetical protein N4A53_10545 [Pelagimonas sp.]|nr:hypothetical protein [Pelagimonas sp.]